MQKEFTKADLKDGMIVEYRNGGRRIVVGDVLYGKTGYGKIAFYSENLLESNEFSEIDIMRVYETKYNQGLCALFDDDNLRLIWKREEVKRMTVEEMRQKLEELTGEKIEIEPSMDEMVGTCYKYCAKNKCSECALSNDGSCN